VLRCQRHELHATTEEQRCRADDQPAGSQLLEVAKGGIDLGVGRGLQDSELYILGARRFPRGSDHLRTVA
jgi:hypothetical protein